MSRQWMRVVTLVENTTGREDLACEHGLSLYIETQTHRILFDAGQTGVFADNAQRLGIDLSTVDIAILSHGHYDHGGGLQRFLQINTTAPVYVHREGFASCYNGEQKYIGLDPALRDSGRLVFVDGTTELAPGVTLQDCNDCTPFYPADHFGLQVQENGQLKPDRFRHEHYLTILLNGKRICFSGCSHKGILNIAKWLQPDVLFGGFHFVKLDPNTDDAQVLRHAAQTLLQHPATYYTGHCTGNQQFEFMRKIMGDRLNALTTGVQVCL